MVNYRFATLIGLAGMAIAVPLNINLGAYSPALVVGDGEISFGGGGEVTSLINALEGAAVNAANGATAPAQGAKKAGAAAIASAPGAAAAAAVPVPAASQQQPAQIASVPTTPVADATTAPNPALEQQAQQIAALQGMGKAIAPRSEEEDDFEVEDIEADEAETPVVVAKRDLASFQAALAFADKALTKGPKINLGTGKEGGAGVGIVVDNTPAGAVGKAKKRDISSRVKVTTMYVRSGIPASLRNSPELVARDLAIPAGASIPSQLFTRGDSPLDAVNLNVDGDKGLTMTFVETITDADDSAE